MKLTSLTYLAFETNAVLDECPDLVLPFEEIHTAAEENRLVEYLAERFGDKADLSFFRAHPEEEAAVNLALADVAGGFYGRESRKTGVERSGLCLVIAFILEAIQRHDAALRREPEPETVQQ